MNGYDAILFDFDGVLADTEPIHFSAWREVLAPHGINLTWDVYVEKCVGVADKEMLDFLRTLAKPVVSLEVLWPEYKNKKTLFGQMVSNQSPIPSSTVALIKSLHGMKLAVVSSSFRAEIEPMLRVAGILDDFGALVFGDDVTHCKPHPEPYLTGAAKLSATRPLVVEDSEAGAASGRAAGFDVLKVERAERVSFMVRSLLARGF